MSTDYADYAPRDVSEEKPVKAWACCRADKFAMSERKPGQPLEAIDGYLPPQVMPWKDSTIAIGYFNLWGLIRERQPQSGPIKYDFVERQPYYVAQYGYPESLWVFDPELAFPLERAFDVSSRNLGAGLSLARDRVRVRSVEWVNMVLRPGQGNPLAAITEDVAAGWQPAKGLHICWRGLWPWRSPSIVRRVTWDDSEPLDPRLIYYHLQGVADIGQAGQRPVLVYKAFSNPAEKERQLRAATKYLWQVR
jgi:hypothetical protein